MSTSFPLLSLILFTPLAGALLLMFVNKRQENAIRWIANLFGAAGFLVSVPLWSRFNLQDPNWQFVERAPWIPNIGADYFLGVDGFVNGSALITRATAWLSGLLDRMVVDGMVNGTASTLNEASHGFRRFQTGLVQNYALLMIVGVFAFVSVYLILR